VVRLERHLERWEDLKAVLRRVPLTAPTDSYYISSGFGMRKDPLTHRRAMHYGTDFSSAHRTPVLCTAAGTVTFSGRNGPYGLMVEIDHGLGLKTRYGHLHQSLVRAGDVVAFRDEIGLMGSTGRSTGSHIHYEVVLDGIPQDPENFLKAGKHVFKN
jgi:murein DD-endopeptidase MepM/ murein hydrolase activator NlpD